MPSRPRPPRTRSPSPRTPQAPLAPAQQRRRGWDGTRWAWRHHPSDANAGVLRGNEEQRHAFLLVRDGPSAIRICPLPPPAVHIHRSHSNHAGSRYLCQETRPLLRQGWRAACCPEQRPHALASHAGQAAAVQECRVPQHALLQFPRWLGKRRAAHGLTGGCPRRQAGTLSHRPHQQPSHRRLRVGNPPTAAPPPAPPDLEGQG